MTRDHDEATTFSEVDAQRIIERATEIESKVGTRLSVADLRQIATHAGIDSEALARAIRELTTKTSSEPPGRNTSGAATRIALLMGTGAALGILSLGADSLSLGELSTFAVFGPSALFTIAHALRHRMRGGLSSLLQDIGIVFGSFTVSIISVQGFQSAPAAMAWSLMCAGLARVIAGLRGHTGTTAADVTTDVQPATLTNS